MPYESNKKRLCKGVLLSFSLFFFFMKNMSLVLLLEAFAFMSGSDYVPKNKVHSVSDLICNWLLWVSTERPPLFILKGFYMDFLPCCLWCIYFRKLFHRRWLTGSFPKYTSGFIFTSPHKKMKFSIKDFFVFLRVFSYLLKKSLMESFIFCALNGLKIFKCWVKNLIFD